MRFAYAMNVISAFKYCTWISTVALWTAALSRARLRAERRCANTRTSTRARHMLAAILMTPTFAVAMDCGMLHDFLASPCRQSVAAWDEGRNELYVSGYAYHARQTYAADRIRELNEYAWGLGFARSVEDTDGDTHSIYALIFRESHFKYQKVVGYQWQTYWHISEHWKAGAGLSAFFFSRSDVANNLPLPFALPAVSLRYRRVTLYGTFIPKVSANPGGNGNVAYVFGGVRF